MRVIAVLITLVVVALPAAAQGKRVALIIVNSAYQHTPKLANPKNDATDMSAALKKHAFQIVEGFDLDKGALERKVRDFATALHGAQVGVFFYAGHGLQVAGHNYLVPVDAQLSSTSALDFEMVRHDLVHRTMEREAQINIIFLDACRDNPLARDLARAMGTRSTEVGRGLAPVESGVGTLISFSTQPGNVALDGTGRNTPFAGALVKQLSTSNDDLSAILIGVRNDVMKETQRKQVPWEHSALTGRFYFGGIPPPSQPPPAPAQLDGVDMARAAAFIRETEDQGRLEAFIKQFGDTPYAEMARVSLEQLRKEQETSLVWPQPRRAEQEQEHTFDGNWEVNAANAAHCPNPDKWKGLELRIRRSQIWVAGSVVGRVSENGNFEYARQLPKRPTIRRIFTGKLQGDRGQGSHRFLPRDNLIEEIVSLAYRILDND
jgi:uncharacterized caspase-like protein